MSTIVNPARPRRSAGSRAVAAGILAALVLAGCGSSGGSEAADTTEAKATTTTAAKADKTTTTEADDEEEADAGGLPTDEADAPSGSWISVRFNVAVEPEPDDFNVGSAEARLYDIEPKCDGDAPCELEVSGGGDDGSFAMPDTEPITGDPITLEPEDGAWTDSYEYPDDVGCTAELDGPYLHTSEERELEPVYGDDGEITGLVGTTILTDTLTDEGRAAGCPASSEATYAYAVVVAPNDGIRDIEEYSVNGTFKQTLEVTAEEGQVNPLYKEGGISTTLPEYDVDLAGSCGDGECSVEFAQVNGDGETRRAELVSEDGRGLLGTFEEGGGCSNDETGDKIFESGAYESTGGYEDLTPVWVEDGEVKAFVGRYYHVAEPTELGKSDPNCATTQSIEAWVYLVDTDSLG
ncbi:MAG TPA: hypothetical protein VNS19_04605 [Acidimicrobiales bacterium]|jgi:hypothetical protein|nr:hypothetical protein [Acidimicrobiales bacterium]